MHTLSKSTFIRGCQCVKSLYLDRYQPELKGEMSSHQEAGFEQGIEAGLVARTLFPNGNEANSPGDLSCENSLKRTKDNITTGETIIYEASFLFNEVFASLDILVKDIDGWKGFEVKSSTEVKGIQILDAALQYYLIRGSGSQ